ERRRESDGVGEPPHPLARRRPHPSRRRARPQREDVVPRLQRRVEIQTQLALRPHRRPPDPPSRRRERKRIGPGPEGHGFVRGHPARAIADHRFSFGFAGGGCCTFMFSVRPPTRWFPATVSMTSCAGFFVARGFLSGARSTSCTRTGLPSGTVMCTRRPPLGSTQTARRGGGGRNFGLRRSVCFTDSGLIGSIPFAFLSQSAATRSSSCSSTVNPGGRFRGSSTRSNGSRGRRGSGHTSNAKDCMPPGASRMLKKFRNARLFASTRSGAFGGFGATMPITTHQ